MFFNEKTYVGVVASGDDLLKLPIVYMSFGPIKTSTHELGAHGWKLRMYQSTPLLRIRTRPKVCIHPKDNRHHGFRWKFRARMPYSSEREVFEDLANEQDFAEFSLTKFETKTIVQTKDNDAMIKTLNENASLKRQLVASERLIKDMMQEDDPPPPPVPDVWEMLAKWNQEQIDSMDWTPKVQPKQPTEPDIGIYNIIDFVEYMKSVKDDNEFDEVIKKMTTGG